MVLGGFRSFHVLVTTGKRFMTKKNAKLQCGVKPHVHEQFFLDKFALTRKNCSCRWGIVDKFSLSRKIWRASFSLTRKNCQVRNLLVYTDNKENVTRILFVKCTCQGKLVIFFIYTTKENLSRKKLSRKNLSRKTC